MRVGCCVVVPLLIAISLFLPTCHAILSGRSIKMSTRARHGTVQFHSFITPFVVPANPSHSPSILSR